MSFPNAGGAPANPPPLAPHETPAFRAYKKRLTEILTKHNPEKLNTVDYLLKQFPNKEHQVYIQICKKCGVQPKPPPDEDEYRALEAERFGKAQPPPQQYEAKNNGSDDDFTVGENCYTKVLSRRGDERWLNARITHVNGDNTYDIFVYQSAAHGVAPEAVNVKREFLKKLTEQVTVAQPPKKEHPRFEQGDRVRVFGLRSHTSYNGLCGTVILYVPSERRYQVRLDTKDVIAIKQRNVCPENEQAPGGGGPGWNPKNVKMSSGSKPKSSKKTNDDIDEQSLSQLMAKMLAENPDTDPAKLGEFAAGYLRAKKKIEEMEQ